MDILAFVLMRLLKTKVFWFFVICTYIGVLALWGRGEYRNRIYQMAAETVGKRYS